MAVTSRDDKLTGFPARHQVPVAVVQGHDCRRDPGMQLIHILLKRPAAALCCGNI